MVKVANPGPANAVLTKPQEFTAAQTFNGITDKGNTTVNGAARLNGNVGLHGVAPIARQAAVAAPTAAPALYDQAQMGTVVDAVNALRARLTALGITL